MKEETLKVDDNLSHLTEYERYIWLMKTDIDMAGKEYNYYRDSKYHYECIGDIWIFMTCAIIVMLICVPLVPYIAIPGAFIVVAIGFAMLCSDYRVDHFKRRKFFEDNGVPNFEEYDEMPLPNYPNVGTLRYLVKKFESEKEYEMWKQKKAFKYSTPFRALVEYNKGAEIEKKLQQEKQ